MTSQIKTESVLTNSFLGQIDRQMIVILDFGSQYSELIARRIRETQVYSEVISYRTTAEQLRAINPKGIILSGGRVLYTMKKHPTATPKFGIWEYRCWECVTGCS